jgi:PII-like signaling protein
VKENVMRVLDGEQILVRILIGDDEKWHHQPLYRALLERLRREGFAGASVFHGVAGFGAASVIHSANIVDLSGDLPVLIEVVDDQEHVDRLLQILDEMVIGGALITTENIRVVKYAGKKGAPVAPTPKPPPGQGAKD